MAMATEILNPFQNGVSIECCGNCRDESSRYLDTGNGSAGQMSVHKQHHLYACKPLRSLPKRHSSTDSGYVLDTIDECCCHCNGKSTGSDIGIAMSRNSSGNDMHLPANGSENAIRWPDEKHIWDSPRDMAVVPNDTQCSCSRSQMNCSPAIYGTTSLTCGSKNLSSPSKSARTRSKSESCCDSESTVFPSRRSDAYLLHNGSPTHDSYSEAMTKDECQTAIPRGKKRRFPLPYKLMCIPLIISATAIALHFYNFSRLQELENKIKIFEKNESKNIISPKAAFSHAGMMVRNSGHKEDDVRPHAHLILKHEENIALTEWSQHILAWTPHIVEGQTSLKYDEKNRCLTVYETGIYFVYNQIYVHRHLKEPSKGMTGVSNHTMFHTIFNKPFNYPSDRTPMVVTESSLGHCWNENADTQIHTSYQGIIVKLQVNDQLLVALKDFNDHVDQLDPKSTFFGVFKL
ncbi:uncharacterized protein LOC120328846 [Styela clava]